MERIIDYNLLKKKVFEVNDCIEDVRLMEKRLILEEALNAVNVFIKDNEDDALKKTLKMNKFQKKKLQEEIDKIKEDGK